jgi:class 3 adenylate cyclase/predicted negative regulator of RcsB-dependent stress response
MTGPTLHCVKCYCALQPGAKFCSACGQTTQPTAPEIERRQLTLLFSELVGAATLSERLDVEEFRDLLASYQRVCADSVGHYEGHLAQLLGDGVMSYFGYPIAHEDDAVRAVRAALRIQEGVKLVNEGIGKRLHAEIHVRGGLHTGMAVVGEVGPGGAHDRLAIGETVNIAARIRSIADPDTVLISGSVAKLVDGYFEMESLGEHQLKGFTQTVDLFRVVRPTGARTNLEAAARGNLTPHVGRDRESAALDDAWKQVCAGADRFVIVRGEAGIGKSRIVHHFCNAALDASARVLKCFCSPLTQATAFAPLVQMLEGVIVERTRGDTSPQAKLAALRSLLGEHSRFGPDALPLIADLLSVPGADDSPISDLSAVRKRAKTIELLREWAAFSAERIPVALLVEDAHWADPSTLEFLDLVARESPGGRTLVCVTTRPELAPRWSGSHVRTIELLRLTSSEIEAMITHVAGGHPLPVPVVRRIAERSEGVPLFVEEVTKAALESGALRLEGDHYELAGIFDEQLIPSTIHASLVARFDRLGASKAVAQLGAAIGREFPYPLIRAVAGMPDGELQGHLDRLCGSELALRHGEPPNARYSFKHALIQDAIYGTLLKTERARVHERIFGALERQFPELVAGRPEIAAYHAEKAGRRDIAVPLLKEAGLRALGRTAVTEAVKHLSRGIELVDALGEPGRTNTEIELQAAIGPAYMATLGWAAPEVERSCARLRDLASAQADPRIFQAMWGLWTVHFLRAELGAALKVARGVLGMATQAGDPMLLVAGHHAVGYTHFYRGEYADALRHSDAGLALFELEREKRIASLFQLSSSCAMWCFRASAQQMVGLSVGATDSLRNWQNLADGLRHPPSRAHLLCLQSYFFHMVDDVERVAALAQAARSLSIAEGFALWVPLADIFLAWARARRGGDASRAVDEIKSLKALADASLCHITELEIASVLAETLLLAGRPAEVFRVADDALAITTPNERRHYEPEVFRFQGDAAKAMGDRERAVAFYRRGIESAQSMNARFLELRSAIGLTRLAGGTAERAALKRILDGFTEGLDQPIVKEALALLSP